MKSVLPITLVTAFAVVAISCGAGNGPPQEASQSNGSPTEPSPQGGLSGTWSGTGVDANERTGVNSGTPIGTTIVTWKLTQTGANVSGTVTTQSTDPLGTTCNSCHRSRTGALSGTLAGTTLTWTLSFPAVAAADPTPACTATLTGTLSTDAENSLTGVYSGEDLCEGPILSGTVTMARQQ